MANTTKATWIKVDVATLDKVSAKALETLQNLNKQAGEARKAFEAAFEKHFVAEHLDGASIPNGYKLGFGFKYGLAVALVPDDEPSKPRGGTSLADLASKLKTPA